MNVTNGCIESEDEKDILNFLPISDKLDFLKNLKTSAYGVTSKGSSIETPASALAVTFLTVLPQASLRVTSSFSNSDHN